MGRGDLSNAECELIGSLLPSERERWARSAGDIGATRTATASSACLAN